MARSTDSTAERAGVPALDSGVGVLLGVPGVGVQPLLALPQLPAVESVAIYQSDCSTPATDFTLGQMMCAKITNAPVGTRNTQVLRRLSIVGPGGYIRSELNVAGTTSTATLSFSIPATATSLIGGDFENGNLGGDTVDNRGTWQVISVSTRDGSVRTKAAFTVTDSNPNIKVADLSLQSAVSTTGDLAAGDDVSFKMFLVNYGPDAAADVVLTALVPANTAFGSVTQPTGQGFTCQTVDGATTCSIASLARGAKAAFTLTYNVNGGTPVKTEIVSSASVTTTTLQRSTRDNFAKAATVITEAEAASTCTLTCPANIVVTANTTVGGQFGAVVKYSAASVSGDCGAVSNNPAPDPPDSGTRFFPVGTHTITSTSEKGGSCTFTIKVLGTAPPTISCPTNKTATAGEDGTATVITGTPTFTPADGTIVAVRSDARPAIFDDNGNLVTPAFNPAVTDPYPTGITGITWTVTDADGRTASCRQTITVNAVCGTDTEPPTITAPANITVFTGADNTGCAVALDDELGQADAHDNCSVKVSISGIPAGNEFPIGTTTLTYTATDPAGNTNTGPPATQTVTVIDNTLPRIAAPPDATYVCMSQVPAANANQATRGEVRDEDGNLLPPGPPFDNCGVPVVAVTETSTGVGSAADPKIITRVFTATDAALNSSSATQTITVIDSEPPTITAPPDASYQCVSEVPAASASQATASDNCAAPGVAVSESNNGGAGTTASPLVITRTYTATDGAGNSASDSQTITVIDNTAPTISAPADVTAFTGPGAASCDTVVSNATLGTASASDNCAGVTVTRSPSGNTFPVGTTDVIWTATDAAGNQATATQHVTVNDNTVPTITAPSDKTLYTGAGATSCSVTVSDLNATLGTATAADNCPGVTWSRGGSNVFPLGETTVTYTATDAHGNTATANQKVTVIDNTPPVVTPPANITVYLPLNSTATSMAVSYPNPATATDNCAGTITFNYSPASGSVFSVGTNTVTVTATDAHNNSATATFTVTVLYNFTGFFSPVANLPTLNVVNAGRAIPVKFSLSGNKGLNIFAADSPYTIGINCDGSLPQADVEETLNAGGSSLSYGPDQYNYVWKTESSWAGTCRQLVVKLNDGSEHRANFKFR